MDQQMARADRPQMAQADRPLLQVEAGVPPALPADSPQVAGEGAPRLRQRANCPRRMLSEAAACWKVGRAT